MTRYATCFLVGAAGGIAAVLATGLGYTIRDNLTATMRRTHHRITK